MRPCSVPGGCGHLHRDDGSGCSDHRTHIQPHCVLPHRAWPDGCERVSTATVGLVCGWHRNRLDLLIEELHDGYASLALIEVAGTSPRESSPRTGRTKNPSPPAPANLDVLGLRDARSQWDSGKRIQAGNMPSVPAVVASWLLLVCEERPLTAQQPQSVLGRLAVLKRHHDWIAGQEWVGDYLAELTELRQAIYTTLVDRPILRTLGACYLLVGESPCTGRLVQDNGSDVVRCTQCRARWVTAEQIARLEVALNSRKATA